MARLSSREQRQLEALVTYHYVVALVQAMGALILTVSLLYRTTRNPVSLVLQLDGYWIVAGTIGILSGLTASAGRRIAERRGYSFCQTVAALNCFSLPFGTMLGVWTLTLLKRPSVRETFVENGTDLTRLSSWEDRRLP